MTPNAYDDDEKQTPSDLLREIDKLVTKTASLEWMKLGHTSTELTRLLDKLRRSPALAPRMPMPFVSEEAIEPGRTAQIQIRPYVSGKIEHILLAPKCEAFSFCIAVGKDSQSISPDLLPGSCFVANAQGGEADRLFVNRWNMDDFEPGILVTMSVLNNGKKAERFEAVAWARVCW